MPLPPLFISAAAVEERFWRLGHVGGGVIAPQIRLAADGRIIGSHDASAAHWRVRGNLIELLDRAGEVATRFDLCVKEASGIHVLKGRCPGADPRDATHLLTELPPEHPPSTQRRVALLVRTHLINDKLLDLLNILQTGIGYDLFVCVDETHGPLPIPGRAVLGHSAAMCLEMGLLGSLPDQNLLWYFGDYPFYCAHRAIPDYDYYAMIEYDVDIVRGNPLLLEGLFNRLDRDRDRPLDLVAANYTRPGPEWHWGSTCKGRFESVYSTFFPFMVLSNRALRYLYDWRRHEAANPLPNGQFVFCEAFVASALNAAGGFICADLRTLIPGIYDAATFRVGSPMLLGSLPKLNRAVELVHPVFSEREFLERHLEDARANGALAELVEMLDEANGLSLTPALRSTFLEQASQECAVPLPSGLDGKRLIGKLLAMYPARDFFRQGSELREGLLSQAPIEDIVEPLRMTLAKERDHVGIVRLHEEAAERGWAVKASDDLAYLKPAVSSSVCRWSRYPDPERDACGANGEPPVPFHTDREPDPWWMVDLVEEHLVEEVAIVNRVQQPERFNTFRIETSSDGVDWMTRFTQAEPRDISWDPDWPWRVCFAEPFPARYVRIVLQGMGPLHLHRVQVFGAGCVPEGKRLIGRLLAKHPPRDLFREGSELRAGLLSVAPVEDIVEPLRRALAKERDHAGVALLYKEALAQGWAVKQRGDLAFCKPAVSSSVCKWSRDPDPERDACGANGEPVATFHTDRERNPWWMVDLLEECWVEQVAIVNRSSESQRFRTFCIETSSDGSLWMRRYTQSEPCDVSSNFEAPWRLLFTDPFLARYVRIVLLGTNPLHLLRVQVFGRPSAAAA